MTKATQRYGRYVKLVGICLAFLTSCARQARLTAPPMDDLLGTTVDLLLNWPMPIFSPIVVVASVTANEPAGPPVPAKRFAGLTLQLHRVDCILENSIKGNRPPDHFHFFYFADPELPGSSDPLYNGAQLFRAKPGGRYIFSLFEELGNLRSVGDVGPFSAVVLSGRHKPGNDLTLTSPRDNHQLGRVITDILLTPGEGLDPASLSAGIDGAVIWSLRFGNRLEAVRKLRELVNGPEPRPADSLCLFSGANTHV